MSSCCIAQHMTLLQLPSWVALHGEAQQISTVLSTAPPQPSHTPKAVASPLHINLIQALCILSMIPCPKVQHSWHNLSWVSARDRFPRSAHYSHKTPKTSVDIGDTSVHQHSSSMHIMEAACHIWSTFSLHCSSPKHCRGKERPSEMLHTCEGHAQSACTRTVYIVVYDSRALAVRNHPSL